MSDETNSGSVEAAKDAEPAPKIRRISNKNPRKSAKAAKAVPDASLMEVPEEEFDSSPPSEGNDANPKSEDSSDQKRKNRRRRGKGKSQSKDEADSLKVSEETIQLADGSSEPESGKDDRQQSRQQQRPQQQRRRPDPEKVANKAWEIFLAEVSEEGVALIGDNDARELSRRCFRLAEIFIEEQERRN